jgi:hypothetical protein
MIFLIFLKRFFNLAHYYIGQFMYTSTPTTGNLALNRNNGSLVSGDLSPISLKNAALNSRVTPFTNSHTKRER